MSFRERLYCDCDCECALCAQFKDFKAQHREDQITASKDFEGSHSISEHFEDFQNPLATFETESEAGPMPNRRTLSPKSSSPAPNRRVRELKPNGSPKSSPKNSKSSSPRMKTFEMEDEAGLSIDDENPMRKMTIMPTPRSYDVKQSAIT